MTTAFYIRRIFSSSPGKFFNFACPDYRAILYGHRIVPVAAPVKSMLWTEKVQEVAPSCSSPVSSESSADPM
ncbi:hypothetical cytosolic protein [Syntrophus aciditrophicus SB]|uniref:Hypothetical cytosolic protein n=1 Tax=Syntrophus aciditrophicus (strain SB) TaxID=56780 RepID=Q2LVR9_SYNAS|nr:hypothetical cytosolic protein [Syntrophus aciditrophicus SB]